MNMGQMIKDLRKQRGMTLEELGEKVGVGKSTVRKWENGMIANMRRDKIAKIANALEVSPGYLMGWEDEAELPFSFTDDEKLMVIKYRDLSDDGQGMVDLVLDLEWRKVHQMPLRDSVYYAGKIAAAGPGVYIDGEEGEVIKVKNKPYAKGVFAVGVNGDSMEPEYYDGDEVYVQPAAELMFGEIGYWRIGSECFIKEYAPDGLRSKNPKYPLMKATPDMVLIGKVIGRVKR